jgi:transposase
MELHGNARLTPYSRTLMCERVREEGWTVAEAAEAAGCTERTCYRWLARYDTGEPMTDRSSAPKSVPGRTSPEVEALIERLRRCRRTSVQIAAELDMPTSTVCAVLRRLGLHRLSRLEPPEPPNRYCRRHPGELIHVDVKKLGRFDFPGHRVTGRGPGHHRNKVRRLGWEFVHVAVDDTSRLAYVEVLENERAATCIAFLRRAIDWFAAHGVVVERVMTDNGSGYRARAHAAAGWRARHQAPPHPALPAPHQRQGRALHPDPPGRVGLRRRVLEQQAQRPGPRSLADLLQLQATPQRPRPQDAHQPHRG